MLVGADFTTWRLLESDGKLKATSSTGGDLIRYLNRLEPHSVVNIVGLISFENLRVHGSKQLLIGLSRLVEAQVLQVVSRVRLIQRIVAHDVLVTREPLGSVIPVRDEFILQTLLVVVESIGHVQSFRRSVVQCEVLRLAV